MTRHFRSSTYAALGMTVCWIAVAISFAFEAWAPGSALCAFAMLFYMTHLVCRAIEEAKNG